ncbi:MAG: hypothetical protein QF903_14255 [Planctomycetota bacterium]|jgi:hypothetical protein|nr:hypothetical protein [Planctomycetota bacterium]MDP6761664.1 hypothetical protein [Planctomycetota bacterium]MDP6990630.1 hypothetical protein [Planctomycetota bacterium]
MSERTTEEGWGEHLGGQLTDLLGAPPGALEDQGSGIDAADSTLKLLVRDRAGAPAAFALCSAAAAPDMVARACARARAARDALGEELGSVIVAPLAEGARDGRSWCVLPLLETLSSARLAALVERRRLRPALFAWLRRATARTVSAPEGEEPSREFRTPLAALVAMQAAPDTLRAAGEAALAGLEAGAWAPRHVLLHNDLWLGNVLIDSRPDGPRAGRPWAERFVLVDWPGSRLRGHPLYDLLRLAGSMGTGRRVLRAEIAAHAAILGCDPAAARHHLVAALAWLAAHLEECPVEVFARTSAACLARFDQAAR